VTPRSVDVYVRRVREKIERDPENPLHLKTVRGAGYRFDAGDK
jgi:two-component system phosphate regulon response regulator PhoB